MLTSLLLLPMMAVSAPLEWQCPPWLYGDGVSCDCGCGIVDPDCAARGASDFASCDTSFCAAGKVPLQGVPALCIANICGDGFVGGDEKCDDGEGVGCDETCLIPADGYTCSGLGRGCSVPRCGDFMVDPKRGENCDDGNEMAGDGCNACRAEPGYMCRLFGGCTPTTCMNGWIEYDWETQTGETCEDGNVRGGDGCSPSCQTEPGYACRWDGCFPVVCGDGMVVRGDFGGGEQCDDRNQDPGDGCDANCQTEPGWFCDDFAGCFQVVCSDLVVSPGEMCDDGNLDPGDGCDAGCQSESGWSCGGQPGPCQQVICGNGIVQGDDFGSVVEECDDNNTDPGDGCDGNCRREPGYVCNETGCRPIVCGDGYIDGDGGGPGPGPKRAAIPIDPNRPPDGGGEEVPGFEQCDDKNDVSGDGCSATCQLEEGWICEAPGLPCVRPVCGDGLVQGTETCDDNNDLAGDGCDGRCLREPGWVCRTPGQLCERMPQPWVCSVWIYGSGDGCDCGCGAPDPDCASTDVTACAYNHCLEDAPWPDATNPTLCSTEPPPVVVEEDPEVVEVVEEVEEVEVVEVVEEPDVVEAEDIGPDVAESSPEVVEEDVAVNPRPADDGCAGGGLEGAGLVGLAALVLARWRRRAA